MWGGHSPAVGEAFTWPNGRGGFERKLHWAGTIPKNLRLQTKLYIRIEVSSTV